MKKIYFLVLSLFLVFGLAGCGGPAEVEINSYVEVTFEGYDTLGQIAEYEFDARKLMSDYEEAFENVSKKDIEKLLKDAIVFENATELKNGDEITVTWDIDEDDLAEFEEENEVKLVFSDFTIEVEDLEELESFDPFEHISLKYEGYAPCASAYVNNDGNRDTIGYYDFSYKMDKYENLSNGDVVTVTVSTYYGDDFVDFCVENYGKIPSAQSKEFVVSGCPEYVRDVKDIPAADLTAMDEYIQNLLKEKTASWVYPDSFYGMTLMGNVFAEKTYKDYYSYVENRLYFVYKVDVDNVMDGAFSYYYYGSIDNLTVDENGKLNYELYDISVPTMYGSWYVSGTYFTHGNLNYEGYQTYDELDAAVLQPLSEKYDTVVNNVDKGIITKVTHEPNDYSKITATLNLSADCFTYKWYQGSYFVSGLTDKGYEEIVKYEPADYVSITLPAATEDGSVVEGFYSSRAEGGYSFSKLVCDDAPRFELVCPDTYTIFYGFYDDYNFDNDNIYKLKNIVLNDGITEIMPNAFRNCSTLESINLPSGIEKIAKQAFSGCTNLKELVIPTTVTIIEERAFENCSSLEIAALDVGTMKIGVNAFAGVTIGTVTMSSDDYIPERTSSWGTIYASLNQANVKKLVIADGVTQIPDYAFEGAYGFTEVVFPATVTSIGVRAFAANATLTNVTMPEGLETIKEEAFIACTELKKLNIPSTVYYIGANAFSECTKLAIDKLEVGNLKIGSNAFTGVTFSEVTLSSDNYVPERSSSWGTIYTPWNGAFVKKLTIADGVTQLPAYAFEYAGGVTEVVIPATVTEVGERAFAGCPDLKTVTMSEGVEVIGMEAFRDCAALRTVTFPDTLAEIKENAFYNCTYLSMDSVDISALKVGAKAFSGATLQELVLSADGYVSQRYDNWGVYTPWDGAIVKKITIKEGVTAIPDYAFEYCEGVTEVVLPSTITTIGTNAFYNSSTLKTVTLNEGVEVIGVNAFKECENLKTVNIPSTVHTIDTDAFHSCSSLVIDKLDISGMTINTYAFYLATINEIVLDSNEFTSLRFVDWRTLYAPWTGAVVKNITITENVTELPAFVFEDIDTVDKIVIPTSVTTIKEYAFSNTNFKEIHIPASVTTLENNVFDSFIADTLTIVTPAGSAAEEHAVASGIVVKNQ